MKEKIAVAIRKGRSIAKIDYGRDANFVEFVVTEEQFTAKILTLLKEEIEKVENPYTRHRAYPGNISESLFRDGFEDCRQKILNLLEGK